MSEGGPSRQTSIFTLRSDNERRNSDDGEAVHSEVNGENDKGMRNQGMRETYEVGPWYYTHPRARRTKHHTERVGCLRVHQRVYRIALQSGTRYHVGTGIPTLPRG